MDECKMSALLAEVLGHYQKLEALLAENREHVIRGNVSEVERFTKLMETVVLKIRLLEETLESHLGDFQEQPDGKVTLSALAALWEPEGGTFTELVQSLRECVKRINRELKVSRQLLQTALKLNSHFLSLIDTELKSSKQYSPQGEVSGKRGAVLLSQKA